MSTAAKVVVDQLRWLRQCRPRLVVSGTETSMAVEVSMRAAAKVGVGINSVKGCAISRKVGLREPCYNLLTAPATTMTKVVRLREGCCVGGGLAGRDRVQVSSSSDTRDIVDCG